MENKNQHNIHKSEKFISESNVQVGKNMHLGDLIIHQNQEIQSPENWKTIINDWLKWILLSLTLVGITVYQTVSPKITPVETLLEDENVLNALEDPTSTKEMALPLNTSNDVKTKKTISAPKKETKFNPIAKPNRASLSFKTNYDGLEPIVSFFIEKKLGHHGIILTPFLQERSSSSQLFCDVHVNQQAVELGTAAFKISFQITATLEDQNGQLIGTPYHQRSPDFFIYDEQEIPATLSAWLDRLTDNFLL